MLRIVGGLARGRRLRAPKGSGTRPTADRVRQSLFDVLGQRLDGGEVLDLYAGSGALGLEALSRGAARAVLVDQDREAAEVCRGNADELGFGDAVEVVRADARAALGRLRGHRFSLVFLDPPYAEGPLGALEALADGALLAEDVRIVAEHDRRTGLPERVGVLTRTDLRRFGDTAVSFFARLAPEAAHEETG